MTKFLAVGALLFAACNDSSPPAAATPSTSPAAGSTAAKGSIAGKATTAEPSMERPTATAAGLTGGPGEPSVDPTMPSWAPESCIAYHKAVVEALECAAIDQGKRDLIQKTYATASEGWKAETNGTPKRTEEIRGACERGTASVHADIEGKCVVAKT